MGPMGCWSGPVPCQPPAWLPCTIPPSLWRRWRAWALSCCSPRPGRCPRPAGAGGPGSRRPRRWSACWRCRWRPHRWARTRRWTDRLTSIPSTVPCWSSTRSPWRSPSWPSWSPAGRWWCGFRRARGTERQQLRWVALAAALVVLGAAVAVLALALGATGLIGTVEDVAAQFCVAVLPVAMGAAILRYRLYDLDRIISRTLAYGLLTLLLGGGYAAVVLGLGQLLGRTSSLVVAAATLAVAAAFQPARRRVQDLVDRRFNRRRYDAAQTIAAFSARLRQQVDLDTLTTELLAVVNQTMQPTRAQLWLRPSGSMAQERGDAMPRPLASHSHP